MASSVLNSDDGVISGTAGLKSVGGDDGVLVFQSKGTETARINTDKQIVAAAGTASLPALTTTGDVNTGIFFPAADTIAFAEGGAEAMRINSSGNVGIGITSPDSRLHIASDNASLNRLIFTRARVPTAETEMLNLVGNAYSTGTTQTDSARIRFSAESAWSASSAPSLMNFFTTSSGSTTPAERMRITSSGNVGIGTSSPENALHVLTSGAGNGTITRFARTNAGNTQTLQININPDTPLVSYVSTGTAAGGHAFITGSTERARITSGGEVYIAGTTDQGAYNLQCNGTGVWGAGAYVNGSDERIKDDIEPIASGLDVVEKLNPVTYRYKESWTKDQSIQTGFIAQELLTALDGQVYVDSVVQQGGSENYYSVAYQNIIPILTKAIQELSAKNDALEARLSALEQA
jgi:hypothetical protein